MCLILRFFDYSEDQNFSNFEQFFGLLFEMVGTPEQVLGSCFDLQLDLICLNGLICVILALLGVIHSSLILTSRFVCKCDEFRKILKNVLHQRAIRI